VHIAVAREDVETVHRLVRLRGGRSEVKLRSSQAALELLRRSILGLPIEPDKR
jgi:hypothetical protein